MKWLNPLLSEIASKMAGFEREGLTETDQHLGRAIDLSEINSDGFTIQYKQVRKVLSWSRVAEIRAFNTDLITTDLIGLEIIYEGVSYFIDEDLPGWSLFVERSKTALTGISQGWESWIVQPPFSKNCTIIYSRS